MDLFVTAGYFKQDEAKETVVRDSVRWIVNAWINDTG
jgi:hypothetical protein